MVSAVVDYTVPEMILIAAADLDRQGQSPFSAEALIVATWQKFPRSFGLKGYTESYPDSNKVLTSIMGEKGLAKRGWLTKMGQKLYALTRDGRNVANRLLHPGEAAAVEPPARKMSRDQEKFLLNLLDSQAVAKIQEKRVQDLNFADACKFWNINESQQRDQLDARLDRLRTELTELERLLKSDKEVVLSTGRSISTDDLAVLQKTHRSLEDRFSRHLNLLRNRTVRN
jgi:hypothetical protein